MEQERWVEWVEPFYHGDNVHAKYCRIAESAAIAIQKEKAKKEVYSFAYRSDQEALESFMFEYWAYFCEPPIIEKCEGVCSA